MACSIFWSESDQIHLGPRYENAIIPEVGAGSSVLGKIGWNAIIPMIWELVSGRHSSLIPRSSVINAVFCCTIRIDNIYIEQDPHPRLDFGCRRGKVLVFDLDREIERERTR